jgi:hypothetical protein
LQNVSQSGVVYCPLSNRSLFSPPLVEVTHYYDFSTGCLTSWVSGQSTPFLSLFICEPFLFSSLI